MKKLKIFIVTYKRCDILNKTLESLYSSDLSSYPNKEIYIINNNTGCSI